MSFLVIGLYTTHPLNILINKKLMNCPKDKYRILSSPRPPSLSLSFSLSLIFRLENQYYHSVRL